MQSILVLSLHSGLCDTLTSPHKTTNLGHASIKWEELKNKRKERPQLVAAGHLSVLLLSECGGRLVAQEVDCVKGQAICLSPHHSSLWPTGARGHSLTSLSVWRPCFGVTHVDHIEGDPAWERPGQRLPQSGGHLAGENQGALVSGGQKGARLFMSWSYSFRATTTISVPFELTGPPGYQSLWNKSEQVNKQVPL